MAALSWYELSCLQEITGKPVDLLINPEAEGWFKSLQDHEREIVCKSIKNIREKLPKLLIPNAGIFEKHAWTAEIQKSCVFIENLAKVGRKRKDGKNLTTTTQASTTSGNPFDSKNVHWISENDIQDRHVSSQSSTCSLYTEKNDTVHEVQPNGVLQRLRSMLVNQLYTDVTFVFGAKRNKQLLNAHRSILAAGSPKFAEMFFGGGREQQNLVTEIAVTFLHFETFKNIIEFLYTDEVFFQNELLTLEIFRGAKYYQIQPLMDHCNSYFESMELLAENACTMLQLASSNGAEVLKNRCSQFIQDHTDEIIRSPSFQKLTLDVVRTICKLPKLNLRSEVELFEAVICWAKAQKGGEKKKVRPVIEPLLKSIRFLAMTMEEFHLLEKRYPDILTKDETMSIMMSLAKSSRDYSGLPSWINKGFSRCFPSANITDKVFEVPKSESIDGKVVIPLKTSKTSQVSTGSFTCLLEMKCLRGRHEIRGVKFSFQDPVHQRSIINSLFLSLTVWPRGFVHTERLQIQNSRDVYVPFGRKILVGAGNNVSISAEAEGVQSYHFLQFDEENAISPDSPFECSIASKPKDNKLYFIREVQFTPLKLKPFVPLRKFNRNECCQVSSNSDKLKVEVW